ncbi:hypothetical protein [Streptomyces sp. Wb2n-11]|uniref:hypothetical protein n=1 Tax=Streptomyces sp. Wb2n-11 TaxID=1030533 RepID=UPI0011470E54|nr:hypothetical protein [Streptomyces sp. Wb2n-11]
MSLALIRRLGVVPSVVPRLQAGEHHAGVWPGAAGTSAKNASLIGEADSGLGMTKHSISAADSDEALKEKII